MCFFIALAESASVLVFFVGCLTPYPNPYPYPYPYPEGVGVGVGVGVRGKATYKKGKYCKTSKIL